MTYFGFRGAKLRKFLYTSICHYIDLTIFIMRIMIISIRIIKNFRYLCTQQKNMAMTKKKLMPGRDALQRYLDEISDSPLMSDAEEAELAQRISQGDKKAADRLATANLRYVVTIARQYLPVVAQTQTLTTDDLISEGNIGLIKAAAKFDVRHGKRFVAFAAPFIRQSIESAIARADKQDPTLSTDESLPRGSNNNFTLLNVLEDKNATPADAPLEQASLSEEMVSAISRLDEREQAVLTRLFGIGLERMTMAEAGLELGLKRERVRQIRDKALRKLRHH